MRSKVEYKIISGRTVEIVRSYINIRSGEREKRRGRVAGSSSQKKIKANEQSSVRELARLINCNYGKGDLLCTLKYDNEHLPMSYEEAELYLQKLMRKYRTEFKKLCGRAPKTVWVTADWNPKEERAARLHHHLVIEGEGAAIMQKLWQGGGLNLEFLDARADHSELAAYLIANVSYKPNANRWHSSRGMERPIYTEPVPVDEIETIQPIKGSIIRESRLTSDGEGLCCAAYMRCTVKERPRVKGGRVYFNRREKAERREKSEE